MFGAFIVTNLLMILDFRRQMTAVYLVPKILIRIRYNKAKSTTG